MGPSHLRKIRFSDFEKNSSTKILDKKMILEMHENLPHRSTKYIYHELRKRYYWPNMKNQISNKISECQACQTSNRKTGLKEKFVTTTRPLGNGSPGLMNKGKDGCHILVGID